MGKTSMNFKESKEKIRKTALTPVLAIFICFTAPALLYGADRVPINVNLIIDGSSSLSAVKDEISSWLNSRLDELLEEGDNLVVWSAGQAARVIYSGRINSAADIETVKSNIRQLSGSGQTADFSGALREAALRQSSEYSYTLLISASSTALTTVLNSPQASLLRFSRIEEYSTWRALVVGLNIDAKVRTAASAFFNR